MDKATTPDDEWDCQSDFGMSFDPEFTEECVAHASESVRRLKLTFGSDNCILSEEPMDVVNESSNIHTSKHESEELRLFQHADDWIFSSVFEKPVVFPVLRDQPLLSSTLLAPSKAIKQEPGQLYNRPKRRVDVDVWTVSHPSVNKKVLRAFRVDGVWRDYVGVVEAYMPANTGEEDQRYRVYYCDDGDEEDLDQAEYDEARMRFRLAYADQH